jgi:hypothetical protein
MQQIGPPICSAKEALARFNRGRVLPPSLHGDSTPVVTVATKTTITSSTPVSNGGRIAGAILTAAAGTLFSGVGNSSSFEVKEELRILGVKHQQRQFKGASNNLLRILGDEPKQPFPAFFDHNNCCANESICNHSDTCSVCSESTTSSNSEGEAQKTIPGSGWANKKAKIKSNKQTIKVEKKKEKSAEGLKDYVYSLSFMDFYEMQKKGCNDKCQHGRECLKKVGIEYIGELRERFWGTRKEKALKPNERRAKIQDIFATAIGMKKKGVR